MNNSKQVLDKAKAELNMIMEVVESEFAALKSEQLNWKPDHNRWSVLECVEHLNMTLRHYAPEIEASIKNGKTPFKETFNSGMFGKKMINRVRPTEDKRILSKMKTFKKTTPPEIGHLDAEKVFQEFEDSHHKLKSLIDKAYEVDLGKTRVKSLAGNILKFRLGDVFPFLIAHEERHLLQAQNVIHEMPLL